jgi:hypothetical protein
LKGRIPRLDYNLDNLDSNIRVHGLT